jgi:release factor glutamine methyltransferase
VSQLSLGDDLNTKAQKYANAVTRNVLLRKTIARLRDVGIPDPMESTVWLAMEAFGCTRSELWSDPDATVDADRLKMFESMVGRRVGREPVQYIVGHTDFFGIRLSVDSRVLIPRPETEHLVETAIRLAREHRLSKILDIGTGSGCIAIALAIHLENSDVTGCDVSSEALDVARANAGANDVHVRFQLADVLEADFVKGFDAQFDLIVSNPPYIPVRERDSIMPEVRDFEPRRALFVDGDPADYYRAIGGHATRLLDSGGRMVLEIHADYAESVVRSLEEAGLREVAVQMDLSGKPRIVTAVSYGIDRA